jgi:ABC-type branched-subunit amino acid transport system ATPase component
MNSGITVHRTQAGSGTLLRVQNLTVRVGIRRVLEGYSLEVKKGDILVITGGNGSGKTTLLNAIAGTGQGVIEDGTIEFMGHDITDWPAHRRAQAGLHYLLQRNNLFPNLTVWENLRIPLGQDGLSRFRQAFPDWAGAIPANHKVALLSGGQQQRLAWAVATLRGGTLLLADEPEAGLSCSVALPVGPTLLLVTHHPERWIAVASETSIAPAAPCDPAPDSRDRSHPFLPTTEH